MGAEARLKVLGIELPTPPRSMGTYVTAARSGNLLFLSGHGPVRDGRVVHQGKVGRDLTDRAGPGGGAPDGPEPPRHRAGRPRQPRPRAAGRQGARHGAVRRRLHRAPEGDQRVLRPHGRGLRRRGPARALRRRHGLPPLRDRRRGRDDPRGVRRGGARAERPQPSLDRQGPEPAAPFAAAARLGETHACRRSSTRARAARPAGGDRAHTADRPVRARRELGRAALRRRATTPSGTAGSSTVVAWAKRCRSTTPGAALRLATANALASARAAVGSLNRLRCVVLTAFVSTPTPAGLAPEHLEDSLALLAAVLAPGDPPAVWLRAAQGLAGGMPVEVELVLEARRRARQPRPVSPRPRRPRTGGTGGARAPRRSGGRTS